MPTSHRVVLDTDIGSDVDDALALAQILGTPSIQLAGVTTVYGDTRLRARLAARVAASAGRRVAVHAGRAETLSGREVWWAGHEGSLHSDLESEVIDGEDAVSFLVEEALRHPGELDVIAIGPLTNIAAAIASEPRFAAAVRHLWVMGGAFGTDEPEHNLVSDVDAAQRVFSAGVPTTVVGLDVTRQVRIEQALLDRIAVAGDLGALLLAEIEQWWRYWNARWNVPHDPVAVLSVVHPELFGFSGGGRVDVDDEGRSRFTEGAGTTRVARSLDAAQVAEHIVAAIVAAGGTTTGQVVAP